MNTQLFLFLAVPMLLILMTSHPDNFLGAGRYAGLVFWGIGIGGTMTVVGLIGEVSIETWSLVATIWLVVECGLVICALLLPQGYNGREVIGATILGRPVDYSRVYSQRVLASRGMTTEDGKLIKKDTSAEADQRGE